VKHEGGATIVEAALVLPVFFLLLLAIFEFALIMSAYHSMVAAAREGARVAVIPDPKNGYAIPPDATVATAVCNKPQPGSLGQKTSALATVGRSVTWPPVLRFRALPSCSCG
jgi:Flp pilus assembly protein TadG